MKNVALDDASTSAEIVKVSASGVVTTLYVPSIVTPPPVVGIGNVKRDCPAVRPWSGNVTETSDVPAVVSNSGTRPGESVAVAATAALILYFDVPVMTSIWYAPVRMT